jgi:dephospho-CoA kinase
MVYSNKKNRLDRIMIRDGAKRAEVERIMKFQLDEKHKIEKSDFIIVNNKSIQDLEGDIEFLSKVLKFLK